MIQCRWLEFLKYYDFGLNYHPDKVNVVVGTLSRKSLHMSTIMVRELEMIEQFIDMSLVYELTPQSMMLGMLKINNDFLNKIKETQKLDVEFVDLMVGSNQTDGSEFKMDEQGVLRFRDKICIPDEVEFKKMIL